MKTNSGLLVIAALLSALTAPVAKGVNYTLTDLGSAYFVNPLQAKVLNDQGEVIGSDPAVDGHAFIHSGGMWHDLGALNTSGMGSAGAVARGLNNSGAVVGQGDTGNAAQTDGFFTPGMASPLAALGLAGSGDTSKDAIAFAINDRGAIVGSIVDNTAQSARPFLFQAGSGARPFPASTDYVFAIDRYGNTLGRSTGDTPHTVVNGVALPKLDAYVPHAMNQAGQILLSVDAANSVKGVWGLIYDFGSGKSTKLPNLSKQSFGYTSYFDINDYGQVVGRGADENEVPHAIFYSAATGLVSLDALNFTVGGIPAHLIEARCINNQGQILCAGYVDGDGDGVTRNFLLTPDAPPVLPIAAAYDGLASVGGMNLGAVSIAVSKKDGFSVKLLAPGISYSFKGALTGGAFNDTVTVKGATLTVNLQVNAAERKVTGTIADGIRTFDVTALRVEKLGIFTGKFTALLQLVTPGPALPQGIGYGRMAVSKSGAIKINGQLGDGEKYIAAAKVRFDGTWAFYAPLYKKAAQPGGIAGMMDFNRVELESDCAGVLSWSNPGGFGTTDVTCKAALFTPAKGAQVLRFTDPMAGAATLDLAGGEQMIAQHTLSVSDKNAVTTTNPDPDPDALAVKLSSANGAMTGSFLHPATGAKASFTGVVQQKLNLGGGVFQGQTTAGSVLLTPQ